MKVNYSTPATHPTASVVQWWVDEIEKRTNGRVELELYLSSELATNMEALATLSGGAYEIGYLVPGFYPAQFPLAAMPSSMMGLTSTILQAGYYAHEVQKLEPLMEEAEANNVHFLYSNAASNYLMLSKNPVTSLDDLKGLKVRTFGPHFPKHVEHFGATPVSIPAIEAYDAFATGAMDAFPTMVSDHVVYNFTDIAKNLYDLKLGTLPWSTMYMNLDVWESLPEDIQNVFTEVSADALEYSAEMWVVRENEDLEKLKADGVTIHPASAEDQQAWNDQTKVLLDAWAADMETQGKGDAARSMIELVDTIKAKYPD